MGLPKLPRCPNLPRGGGSAHAQKSALEPGAWLCCPLELNPGLAPLRCAQVWGEEMGPNSAVKVAARSQNIHGYSRSIPHSCRKLP